MQNPEQKPGWGYGVYAPPATASARPAVILWYRVYALATGLVYVLAVAEMCAWGHAPPLPFVVATAAFALLYCATAFVPLTPRGWLVGLATIGLGLVSCFFPAAIWLLIVWCRPITKAAFGRV